MITQKVSMWGNSLGVRLPQAIIQQVGWKEGALVTISVENDQIILSPAKPKYTLEELLKNVTPQMQHDEVDFGDPVGEEIW
ncbi:AbrB/MazE/SpoVT family DNA-binding domain-containing protein [Aphanothece hegewaldii CCALA 016]|uniref:AbrB/MazE/SpoVT family DNA-binding domain-containing protein n=1 Tax=Aphanothece hegewaldii CCALA 016 TaxID=2107694 RepID=A0A2T1LSK9_9CHRO|nr:AbrB/MazE/SpoVT family DNA-binding domain-containing protein [Aphanothece hegewaldii]PSF32500.1 AbrB/MazE/SpoVT family DNA-binding domain-containing protein [Aphanothece hegewaldii CCALA 016]